MTEGTLHLIFDPAGHLGLPARVRSGDAVVLMSECAYGMKALPWPCDVRVLALDQSTDSLLKEDAIDYRELVALTVSYSRILSW